MQRVQCRVPPRQPVTGARSWRTCGQVAGTNYKVKIKVGDSAYIHATIFKPLPHTQTGPSVSKVDTGKSEADAL